MSEYYNENPRYKTQKEIKHEKKQIARKENGLSEQFVDIKNNDKDPSLQYVEQPEIRTKKELEERRRKENFEEFKKSEVKQGTHKDAMQRLIEREDCYLRLCYKEVDGKTKRQLQEDRKKEMLDYNMKTFGKVSIGVHGKELPRYSDDEGMKEWWKLQKGYQENPHYQSAKQMHQDKKYWAKNDELYLSDIRHPSEPAPQDPFKTTHIRVTKKSEVKEKVNHVTY